MAKCVYIFMMLCCASAAGCGIYATLQAALEPDSDRVERPACVALSLLLLVLMVMALSEAFHVYGMEGTFDFA